MTPGLHFKTTMAFEYGVPMGMSPGVVRIVANNPGPFTFKGTNTYIAGSSTLAVIDPGPDDAAHRDAILAAASGRRITHILITHTHRDHVDGLKKLQEVTGAPSCGFPRGQEARGSLATSPSGTEFVDLDFNPEIELKDGDRIDGADWALTAIHTPGHAPDHMCFALEGRSILFSGDHVMAWNTTVVAPPEGKMSDYMRSLETLLARTEATYLPGHGGRIDDAPRTVKAYLLHRRWREQAILGVIRKGVTNINAIVPLIYQGLDNALQTAASLSVLAHVEHLIERGLVTCEGPATFECRLSAV